MNVLEELQDKRRLLFSVPLKPRQGDRFQPTGFPNLGAATYQTNTGMKLLVESAQSMANRLEEACWDTSANEPVNALEGISHVTVKRQDDRFLTDSMTESHRINSPYILEDKPFLDKQLRKALSDSEAGPVDRKKLLEALLKYDVGCLIHGVFLVKKIGNKKSKLQQGRFRLARALSAFIEADGVNVAASGGVKNDHVNPSGNTNKGFGNVPFSRDEFTAEKITCYVNLDIAQIRGYGLGEDVENLLLLLSLYKLRKLFEGDLRLRTACDLIPDTSTIKADHPENYELPSLETLEPALREAIEKCKDRMVHTEVTYNDKLDKKAQSE